MRFCLRSARFSRWCALFFVLGASLLHAQTGMLTLTETISASPEPSAYEAGFTLTASLTPRAGGPVPSGTVTFSVDGATVGTPVTVAANSASYTITSPTYSIANHTIAAAYSGDSNYAPVSQSATHTVRKLEDSANFTPPTQTIYYGQSIQGSGQVTASEAAKDASLYGGTLSFFADGNDVCDIVVSGQTQYCPNSAGLGYNGGNHVLTVSYSGNQYYLPSSVYTATFTVLPDDTTAGLQSTGSPIQYGQNVVFTIAIQAPYATPTGQVTVMDGASVLGTAPLDSTGTAKYPISTLSVGTHTITAVYSSNQNFNSSISPAVTQVVTAQPAPPALTATLLNSSVNPSVLGQTVTFTAAVATTGAFVQVPSGTVTFNDGTTVLGTGMLDASGTAKFSTSALAVGQHAITAVYGGATGIATSTSASLVQVVTTSLQSAGVGFLLSVTPASITVGVGNTVILNVLVTPLNGFNQPVQLSCVGAPNEMGCNFALTTFPQGGGTTTVAISPAAPHDCGGGVPYFVASGRNTALPILAVAGIVLFVRRRRFLKGIALAMMLCLLPALSGCGTGNCTDLGVRPGTYTFTVQGTSTGGSSMTESQTIQMTVHY